MPRRRRNRVRGEQTGKEGGVVCREKWKKKDGGGKRGRQRCWKRGRGRRGLNNQDRTTVCKRPSPAVSKQEEAACAPCGLGAGGGGGAAQGPWRGRPGDKDEEEALEGAQKAKSRGCLSSRVSFAWVGAWPPAGGSPRPPRLLLQ